MRGHPKIQPQLGWLRHLPDATPDDDDLVREEALLVITIERAFTELVALRARAERVANGNWTPEEVRAAKQRHRRTGGQIYRLAKEET